MTYLYVPHRERVVCTGQATVTGYTIDWTVTPASRGNGTFPITGTPTGGLVTQRIVSTTKTLKSIGATVIGGVDVMQYTFESTEGGTRTLRWNFPYRVNNLDITFLDIDNDPSRETMAFRAYNADGVLPWNQNWVVQRGADITDEGNGRFSGTINSATAVANANQSVSFFVPDTITAIEFDLIKLVSTGTNHRNFLVGNPHFCEAN